MKELLDAVDACVVAAREDGCCETLVQPGTPDMLVPRDLWEKLCIERSKLEPDAPEMQRGPDMLADVRAFLTIGHPNMLPIEPGIPEFGVEALCRRLINEELLELDKGRAEQDLVQIADAVQDLIWVVICLGFAYGLPMSLLWREVARTNLAKFPGGVVFRRPEDGKIMKPEGWEPPRIREIVASAFLVTPLPQALDALLRPPVPVAPDPHCKECGVPVSEKEHGDLCDSCETKKLTEATD